MPASIKVANSVCAECGAIGQRRNGVTITRCACSHSLGAARWYIVTSKSVGGYNGSIHIGRRTTLRIIIPAISAGHFSRERVLLSCLLFSESPGLRSSHPLAATATPSDIITPVMVSQPITPMHRIRCEMIPRPNEVHMETRSAPFAKLRRRKIAAPMT